MRCQLFSCKFNQILGGNIRNIYILLLLSLSFGATEPQTGWSYDQATRQSFYLFEEITIDGEVVEGNGCGVYCGDGSTSNCYIDGGCDVVGAFVDREGVEVCVGWRYADANGNTTLALMGAELNNQGDCLDLCDYLYPGEPAYIKIYDSSYGSILDLNPSSELPGFNNNDIFILAGTSTANNAFGCTDAAACNYDANATSDDGSCLENDCLGDCGGDALVDECGICVGDNSTCVTVTDFDGNIYGTVRIGEQLWMAENLKVTNYRDGSEIQYVQQESSEPDVWENLSTGAYGYYNDDPSHLDTYGNLYNWYAVDDSRGLCMEGWHVPSDDEYTILTDYLGGESAGGEMKEAGLEHWNSPNTGATNESGFTAFPAGYRSGSTGSFNSKGNYGDFWSSSESSSNSAWYRRLNYDSADVLRGGANRQHGSSVRCLYNLVWYVSNDGSDLNIGDQENPFATIQHGIDAADDGWIVMVAAGTYSGNGNIDLDFDGKAITVMSQAGAEQTIIDCGGADRGFTFDSLEDATSVLDGFTITNGSRTEGGGIYCWWSSPTIHNCIITNNTAEDIGGGIFLYQSSTTIKNCIISSNSASQSGGGIFLFNSNVNITNSSIEYNYAWAAGGGISINNYSQIEIQNVNFIGNNTSASAGGAIDIRQSVAYIYYSLFSANWTDENAGAINMWDSTVELNNVTMANNSANWYGGAIYITQICGLRTNTTLSVHNSIISQNTAGIGGDNIYSESCEDTDIYIAYSNVDMTNSDIGDGNLNTFGYSINEDPLFIDAENDDYNLLSNSPCIDTGSTDGNYYGDFEITDYNGSAPDMGAFESDFGCSNLGDINGDGGWNVLDIVTLVNCILSDNCEDLENGCAGDINDDGGWNILDVVTLVSCVLAANCG